MQRGLVGGGVICHPLPINPHCDTCDFKIELIMTFKHVYAKNPVKAKIVANSIIKLIFCHKVLPVYLSVNYKIAACNFLNFVYIHSLL